LLAGFTLLPLLGVRGTVFIAVGLNLFAALIVILSEYRLRYWKQSLLAIAAAFGLGMVSTYSVEHIYRGGMYGISGQDYFKGAQILFEGEGRLSTVTVMQVPSPEGPINRLFIDGQGSSSLRLSDIRVSVLLGYLPRWLRPELEDAAVIGFGVGGASRVLANGVKTTAIEIEPEVVNAAPFFEELNRGIVEDPNHQIIYNDARNFLLRTKQKFGIIVNHPLDPNRAYSSLLFTHEFFNIVKSRLKPGGVYVQWFPVYNMSKQDFADLYTTLDSIFPYQIAFANSPHLKEIIFICSNEEIPFDRAVLTEAFKNRSPEDQRLLRLAQLDNIRQLFDIKVVTNKDLAHYREIGSLLTDDQPRLEFTAAINDITGNAGELIISELSEIRRKNLLQERQ